MGTAAFEEPPAEVAEEGDAALHVEQALRLDVTSLVEGVTRLRDAAGRATVDALAGNVRRGANTRQLRPDPRLE